MLLNMQGMGKVLSKKWRILKEQGFLARNRISDEEKTWTETKVSDGKTLNPDLYRVPLQPDGGRYEVGMVVDVRDLKPGDHTGPTHSPNNR
jgi:hypothetical protein